MQVNSMKAIIAALAIVSLATACTSRHEESKSAGAPKASGSVSPVNPSQLALNDEMKHYQEGFDFSNLSLARKIAGLSLLSIDQEAYNYDTYYLKGQVVIVGAQSPIELSSDAINSSDLRKGALIPVKFDGQAASAALGSPLIIKARCMDDACRSVSMWFSTASSLSSVNSMDSAGQASNSAGYIFSGKTGSYVVSASQVETPSALTVENAIAGPISKK